MADKRFTYWNRKLHYYLGLYFLFFLWLFSLTGLMLNHQDWLRDLYARVETTYESDIAAPSGDDVTMAREVMRQLNLRGEIDWPSNRSDGHIAFNVSRPNGAAQVRVDLKAGRASVREFSNTHLHAFQTLHTFSGSRFTQPSTQRDWRLTSVWVFAMDALAAGLIAMVLGSYYMWWQLKKQKVLGIVALGAGFAACGVFVAGFL